MKNPYILYGIFFSLVLHVVFFSNIEFEDILSNNPVKNIDIELVQIPPEINKNNLILKEYANKKGNKKIDKENLSNKKNINGEEIYCELCAPVNEIADPISGPVFGKPVKSILMIYRVFHDLGPNKGSIKKIKPFGIDGGIVGGEESKTISEVGNLEINYKVNQNKYEIDYEANAKGLTSIFYSKPLIQISKGSINTLGLKPDYYLYNHGKKKKSEAFFDWENKTLTINRKKTINVHDLIDEAQDQLSFMFQFMFLDPLNKMQIPITNAKVFKIYNYHYIDEAKIDTKLGKLDTLHVAKFNYQSPERIDLWLAKEYGYLPVIISITQDDLSTIIQKIETLIIKKVNE